MQRSFLTASILLLALLGAIALWWLNDSAPDIAPAAAPENAIPADPARATAGTAASERTTTAESERTPANAIDSAHHKSTSNVLRIRATWPDESPAEGVRITMRGRSRAQGWRVIRDAVADDEGRVTFADVPIGTWSLRSDRGDRQKIEVTGGEQDVRFTLEDGVAVTGTVVDEHRRAVGGASIWLQTSGQDWSSGRVLTTAAADGTFTLAHVPDHVSLAAIADGHSPSKLLDMDTVDTTAPPVAIELQLGPPGGELVGYVLDMENEPIAGALVTIGRRPRHLDMRGDRVIEKWSTRTERSDEHGAFSFVGIGIGKLPISIQADGYGLFRAEVTIAANRRSDLQANLHQAGTVYGTVTDGNGDPMAGAIVQCYDKAPGTSFIAGGQIDFDEPFGHLVSTADAKGRFTLHDVTPGEAHLFAQPGGKLRFGEAVLHDTTQLAVEPGARVEWNPVLDEGHTVEGVVYFRDGHPMPHVFITLTDERSNKEHVQTNDKNGLFRFVNLDDSTYSARVQMWDAPKGTPPLQRAGIVPNQGRVELHATFDKPVKQAPGQVSGRIDDVAGRITNSKEAHLVLSSDSGWFRENGKIVDGAFRFDDVTPCRFRLSLVEDATVIAQTDWFTLEPGATLDTGIIRTEPAGKLRIEVTRPAGTESFEPTLYLRNGDAWRSTHVKLGRSNEELVENLTPGTYTVSGYAKGMVSLKESVTIQAHATATLTVSLQPGVLCNFQAWLPAGEVATSYTYTITGAQGELVTTTGEFGSAPTRPFLFAKTTPKGDWSVEFSTDTGLTGRGTFVVRGDEGSIDTRIDLTKQ